MRVVVVDAYHDSDRGGAGILAGLLGTMYSLSSEQGMPLETTVVYRYSADDSRFDSAARHTAPAFPQVRILGAPLTTVRPPRRLGPAASLVRALWTLAIPSTSSDPAVAAMREADVVVSKGGHFYQFPTKGFFRGALRAFYGYYTLLLALRMGKPLWMVGHSFGPFASAPSRWLTRYVVAHAAYVGAREPFSRDLLAGIGARGNVGITPDTAFALEPAPAEELVPYLERYQVTTRQYAVMTARKWDFGGRPDEEIERLHRDYRQALAGIADYLVDSGAVEKVLLVAHNDGRHEAVEDDGPVMHSISKLMRRQDAALEVSDDLSPAIQSALYGRARLTIGTRMHSAIFALIAGGPAIAVSYVHKTDGIMRMVGLQDFVLPIDSISVRDGERLIDRLLGSEDEIMSEVARRVEGIRGQIADTVRNVLRSTQAA